MSEERFFSEDKLYVLNVPKDQLKQINFLGEHGEAEFYRFLAHCVGADFGQFDFDCRKIFVSRLLIQQWYDSVPPWEDPQGLATALLLYGPKADDSLRYTEVMVEPGGIRYAGPGRGTPSGVGCCHE